MTTQQTTDLCERLQRRHSCKMGSETTVHHLINPDGPEAAATIEQLQSRISAVRAVIEQGYPEPQGVEKCPHDRYGWEGCIACYDDALLTALDGDLAEVLTRKVNHEQAE